MGNVFLAVPAAMEAFTAASQGAAATIAEAGSADSEAMLAAAAAALGPIGATYLAAYGPAQLNNLTAVLQVAHVYSAIGSVTDTSKAAIIATDYA